MEEANRSKKSLPPYTNLKSSNILDDGSSVEESSLSAPNLSNTARGSLPPSKAAEIAPSDRLSAFIVQLPRYVDVITRHFDLLVVEMLAKVLLSDIAEKEARSSGENGEKGRISDGSASSPSVRATHPQVSPELRSAFLTMGFVGVKRVVDAIWASICSVPRCHAEYLLSARDAEVPPLPVQSDSVSGSTSCGPLGNSTTSEIFFNGAGSGSRYNSHFAPSILEPRRDSKKMANRGLTTIVVDDHSAGGACATNAGTAAAASPIINLPSINQTLRGELQNCSASPLTATALNTLSCNSDCKVHLQPQVLLSLQKESAKKQYSFCQSYGLSCNSQLLQHLLQELYMNPNTLCNIPQQIPLSPVPTCSTVGASNPYLSSKAINSPSPPTNSQRLSTDAFQRRYFSTTAPKNTLSPTCCGNGSSSFTPYTNPTGSLALGGSGTDLTPPSASPMNGAPLPSIKAPCGAGGSGELVGASPPLTISINDYPEILTVANTMDFQRDDKGASLKLLKSIDGIREALCLVLVHYHLSEQDIVTFVFLFTETLFEACQRVSAGTSPIFVSTAVVLPLITQWFDQYMLPTYLNAKEILQWTVAGGISHRTAHRYTPSSSDDGPGRALPLTAKSTSGNFSQAGSGSSYCLDHPLSPSTPTLSQEPRRLALAAHRFFKNVCPLRYVDPRLCMNSSHTPTLFQESLTRYASFVIHSTDLVYLQPSGNPSDMRPSSPLSSHGNYSMEWSSSSKMWSIRTRLIALRGHYLYVYSAMASTSTLTEGSGEPQSVEEDLDAATGPSPYDSPITILDLSRHAGSSLYLVSGPHDVESVTLRTPGRASGWKEQPVWNLPSPSDINSSASTAPHAAVHASEMLRAGGPMPSSSPQAGPPEETEVLRTYDTRKEVQLLTVPYAAPSSPSTGSTAAPPALLQWLSAHHHKSITCGPIRQRMYPIRVLCGNELHHFLFQSPGSRAKWYKVIYEISNMHHNKKRLIDVTSSFCNMSSFIRNRFPYPVGPGAFECVSMLGAGTYGHVLLVKHKLTRKKFAMKVVEKSSFVCLRSIIEVRREHAILDSMDCPYIMKLHDTYQTDTCVYFLLDFLSGGDLLKHIQSAPDHHLSENMSRFIIAEVAIALEHLRVRGIVHRDLKGDNLVMDAEGHVVVTDFGFAKRITVDRSNDKVFPAVPSASSCDQLATVAQCASFSAGSSALPPHGTNSLRYHLEPEDPTLLIPQHNRCGTVAYIAPEVLRSSHQAEGYGLEVDWWSLGVVFFTLLTGLFPFFKENPRETTNEILNNPVRFPHEMRGGKNLNLSKEAQHLVLHLLEKQPERRITSLQELKQHPFFKGFDWEACEERRLLPPQELHLDLYAAPAPSKEVVENLKRRVEWVTQMQLEPPSDPPERLPGEGPSPYQTSEGQLKEYQRHTKELEEIGKRFGLSTPESHVLENDIFNPIFTRQERCGSDRDLFQVVHDAASLKGERGQDPTAGIENEVNADYIPHAPLTPALLGQGLSSEDGVVNTTMSGSFTWISNGNGSVFRSIQSPMSTPYLGFSVGSIVHPIFPLCSDSEDGDVERYGVDCEGSYAFLMDPILEDFDEDTYNSPMPLYQDNFIREGDTSMYRPCYRV